MHFILFLASKHTLICGWSWIWIRKGIEWKWDDRGVSLNHAFFSAPLKSWEERNPSCPAGVTEGHPRDKPLAGLPWQPTHPDCRDSHTLFTAGVTRQRSLRTKTVWGGRTPQCDREIGEDAFPCFLMTLRREFSQLRTAVPFLPFIFVLGNRLLTARTCFVSSWWVFTVLRFSCHLSFSKLRASTYLRQ